MLIEIIIFTAILAYAALAVYLWRGWKTLKTFDFAKSARQNLPKISLVIPFRNEEKNLPDIINSILKQSLPPSQIIFVNDHSTDNFAAVFEHFKGKLEFELHSLPDNLAGKKNALLFASEFVNAKNIVITTDADCMFSEDFILSQASFHQANSPALVIAPVLMRPQKDTLFHHFQAIEYLSLTASGAATAAAKNPILCSGANLSFPIETMRQNAEIYRSPIQSGDDMMLLQALKSKQNATIQYLFSPAAIVSTHTAETFSAFVKQRARWTAKSKNYTDFSTKVVAVIVLFCSLAMLFSLLATAIFPAKYYLALVIFGAKTILDYPLLRSAARAFGLQKFAKYYLPTSIFYPFYTTFIFFRAFFGSSWKARRMKK